MTTLSPMSAQSAIRKALRRRFGSSKVRKCASLSKIPNSGRIDANSAGTPLGVEFLARPVDQPGARRIETLNVGQIEDRPARTARLGRQGGGPGLDPGAGVQSPVPGKLESDGVSRTLARKCRAFCNIHRWVPPHARKRRKIRIIGPIRAKCGEAEASILAQGRRDPAQFWQAFARKAPAGEAFASPRCCHKVTTPDETALYAGRAAQIKAARLGFVLRAARTRS